MKIKADRAKYWLGVGATASGTLHNLLVREGIVKGKKRDVRPAKIVVKPEEVKKEEPKVEETPKEEPKAVEPETEKASAPEGDEAVTSPEENMVV